MQLQRMLRREATEIALCAQGDVVEIIGREPVVMRRSAP